MDEPDNVVDQVRAILADAIGDCAHCRFTFEAGSETDPRVYWEAAEKMREIAAALDRCGDLLEAEFPGE